MLKKSDIDGTHYRDAMAQFAGAVHVITTDGAYGRRGVTIIAACSVSDNPPMVLACLNRENEMNDRFAQNGVFALNTLAAMHQPIAHAFAGLSGLDQEQRFAMAKWHVLATGAPVLSDALAVFDCELVETKDIATHRILFGMVRGLRVGDPRPPLVYHDRGYGLGPR